MTTSEKKMIAWVAGISLAPATAVGIWMGATFSIFSGLSIGLGIWILVSGCFIGQGMKRIPADPPHRGLLTVWGKRQEGEALEEGWHFLPIFPTFHGVILVNMTNVNQDLGPQRIMTPDRAELTVPVSLTWAPDLNQFQAFLDNKGEGGVKSILDDVVPERLRNWAFSKNEGPMTWEEVMGAREYAVGVLAKRVAGNELVPIPSKIPTTILLKYFHEPQIGPWESEKERFGENWEKVTASLAEEYPDPNDLEKKLKPAVKDRQKQIDDLQAGKVALPIPELGIVLRRLNIDEIELTGEAKKAADARVREQFEQDAELLEIQTDTKKAEALQTFLEEKGATISREAAYGIIMQWKATREGHGFTIPGLSLDVTKLAEAFLNRRQGGLIHV